MRGALEPLAGIKAIDVIPGRRTVWVAVERGRVAVVDLLATLSRAGEPAAQAR